jgi:tetratricopeptide (TPR) repeat protein
MTVTPLEEVRRRRALAPLLRAPEPVHRPIALTGSAVPPPPPRGGSVLPWMLAVVFFFAACSAGTGWWLAVVERPTTASAAPEAVPAAPSAEKQPATKPQRAAIDRALTDLRSGLPVQALSTLRKVRAENPQIPSIDYLVALASLQAGDRAEAETALALSLTKGERVSDALALQANLEASAEGGSVGVPFGSLEPVADRLLREAIEADAANPYPYFELAMRLRARGDHQQAKEMLESARVRLQPVDAHTAVDVSLRLLELQETADADLPEILSETTGAADLFGAAYLGFRRGRPEEAVEFLRRAGEILPEDMVAYLAADPSFKTYRNYLRQGWALLAP